jgi:putative flippase GtrA
VRRLHRYLTETFPYTFQITIADSGSTDGTSQIADWLGTELPGVRVVHLARKGRGRALRQAWSSSSATVLSYMDVDLSTDLAALLPLVAPLISGHSDLAIGSRLRRESRVVRGAKRQIISRCYNLMLHGTLAAKFSDAQCGFKAIRRDVAQRLLPLVQDGEWFFDTELLVLAERAGLRIHEVPVDWIDDPDSRVEIVPTAMADMAGIWRLGRALAAGTLPIQQLRRELGRAPLASPKPALAQQVIRFVGIGVASTLAYTLLFALGRLTGMDAQLANLLALLVTAVGNTALNRRFTFGIRGAGQAVRHQFQGLFIFVLGLALTSGSLALVGVLAPGASRLVELTVLTLANLTATVLRFALFRTWVFRTARP